MNNAIYKTKLGYFEIGYKENYVISIKKTNYNCSKPNTKNSLTNLVYQQLNEYFEGERTIFTFPYKLIGTSFQIKVWEALINIPYGETRTYKEIAIQINNEHSSRAVGNANNRNPILIAVPCHRVIGSSGKLVGYSGGIDTKQKLLELEKNYK